MTIDSTNSSRRSFGGSRPITVSPREDADTHPELVYGSVDFTAKALLEPDLPGCLFGSFGWQKMT